MIPSVIDPNSIYKNFETLNGLIGNTTLHKLNFQYGNLYTKFEYQNFFGSIKDRSAYFILKRALEKELIDPNTTVIESSSGNFAIALSGICKTLGTVFLVYSYFRTGHQKTKNQDVFGT
jgi:cysteine synthase A